MTRIVTLDLGFVKAYALKGDSGIVLVDGGYPGRTLSLALAKAGIAPEELKIALVTHAHRDHFGGLAQILDVVPSLPIACGRADAVAMAAGVDAGLWPLGIKGRIANFFAAAAGRRKGIPNPGLDATVLFEGGEPLHAYGVDAEVIAVPGHTPGSIALFVPDAQDEAGRALGKVGLIGDLVMGGFLFKQLPGPPFFAEGWPRLRSSLSLIKAKEVSILLPGHGGPIEAGRAYRRYGI